MTLITRGGVRVKKTRWPDCVGACDETLDCQLKVMAACLLSPQDIVQARVNRLRQIEITLHLHAPLVPQLAPRRHVADQEFFRLLRRFRPGVVGVS